MPKKKKYQKIASSGILLNLGKSWAQLIETKPKNKKKNLNIFVILVNPIFFLFFHLLLFRSLKQKENYETSFTNLLLICESNYDWKWLFSLRIFDEPNNNNNRINWKSSNHLIIPMYNCDKPIPWSVNGRHRYRVLVIEHSN